MSDRNQSESDSMPRWDDDVFRASVIALATQRGRSVADVCRSAGLSASYLARPAGRSGRSIEALMGIARALGVSLIELVRPMDYHDAMPTDENLARVALVADIAAHLYVALGARPEIPRPVDVVTLISEVLRKLESGNQ